MKILNNISLSRYTTFRMGGICKNLYIPESEEELVELVRKTKDCRFIGGGSNLLINDDATFDNIVLLRKFSDSITFLPGGIVESSASIPLSKLIKTINENGYGGIEYLNSVPGLVGGAIYMNAGRGRSAGCSISDHVISVRALCIKEDDLHHKPGEIIELTKEECLFNYRYSRFKNDDYLILSAKFLFKKTDPQEAKRRIDERRDWCLKTQDRSGPNFGSVFREQNSKIMRVIMKVGMGDCKGVHFSKKAQNWLINSSEEGKRKGYFKDTIKLIERVKRIHKFFRKKCVTEVIIWSE